MRRWRRSCVCGVDGLAAHRPEVVDGVRDLVGMQPRHRDPQLGLKSGRLGLVTFAEPGQLLVGVVGRREAACELLGAAVGGPEKGGRAGGHAPGQGRHAKHLGGRRGGQGGHVKGSWLHGPALFLVGFWFLQRTSRACKPTSFGPCLMGVVVAKDCCQGLDFSVAN